MAVQTTLPTLYQYYTGNGITAGLSDGQPYFTLNDKNITIFSGAFHYFRVPRAYWADRLKKIKAAGLNAVETYVPWNLHEPHSGVYDFGNGGTDFEDFLRVEDFLREAKKQDLFAIVRPGPYICAEWEFGGLPSWLLRNTSSVRTSKDRNYMNYVKRYFGILLPLLALLQFQNGGPIIAFQIENEYGNTFNIDPAYLSELKRIYLDNGIKELLFTSDTPATGLKRGSVPGVLQTANFNAYPKLELDILNLLQYRKPSMVMEHWTGWYDYWTSDRNTGLTPSELRSQLQTILEYPSSVNFYMFIGSTSWGFLNGANTFLPGSINSGLKLITTSYDYGAPITEYGNYTEKYYVIKELIAIYNKVNVSIPPMPAVTDAVAYPPVYPMGQILLTEIIDNYENKIHSEKVVSMENLPINDNSGQSFGYVVYRKTNIDLKSRDPLIIKGFVRDTVLVLVNGKLVSPVPKTAIDIDGFGFWKSYNSRLKLTDEKIKNATLDLIVENFGRNDIGLLNMFRQFKGLTDDVYIGWSKIKNWQIIPLEFKKAWNVALKGWHSVVSTNGTPALYKFVLSIPGEPKDTFVDMREWNKGITIVNGFVLGRHFFLGPQQTLYLPAPLLKTGDNVLLVFEHYNAPSLLKFLDEPIYGKLELSNK